MARNFRDCQLPRAPGDKEGSLPCRASGKDGHEKTTKTYSLVPKREPSLNEGTCLVSLSNWPTQRGGCPSWDRTLEKLMSEMVPGALQTMAQETLT